MTALPPARPGPRWRQHSALAESLVDDARARIEPDASLALSAAAQVHATLALVELLRELQSDFADLRRDVSRLAAHR